MGGPVTPLISMNDPRVPACQEPVNELAFVRTTLLMSWGELAPDQLAIRLASLIGVSGLFVFLPLVFNYDVQNELVSYTFLESLRLALIPAVGVASLAML